MAPRRRVVPVAVHRPLVAMRRDDARRDRRLPRALPQLPSARRRRRPGSRGQVRQSKARAVSLGLQPPATRSVLHARRRKPPHPSATDIHKHARDRGASHTHATRVLGRAGSQVTWRLWHDHDAYGHDDTPPYSVSSETEVDTGGLIAAAEQPSSSWLGPACWFSISATASKGPLR